MNLGDLITPESVLSSVKVENKTQLFDKIAQEAAPVLRKDHRFLQDALVQREHLGSTGVGNGIAIPHCKIAGIRKTFVFFAPLARPIDFKAVDEEPVDIVFALFAPENAGADHLKSLARISRLLRDPKKVAALRKLKKDADAIYALLSEPVAAV